ncbi:flagellar hook-length control protein FliK [Anaerotignum sp.]|uniref:flagellar hook-length control protein FliK n=1 Tax=Anaerotignum sp. TaxID=2039241 RepID=UPI0028B02847|nr:flagellar hook-length control protein FliK [Anaerotignum sp.]
MNTCSVSANKNIPESNKVGIKSKANQSEDRFKDMIKNVSSDNKPVEKNKPVKKEEKDLANPNAGVNSDGQSSEKKDEEINIADLASIVSNSAGILDSVQLVKIVNLSMDGQVQAAPMLDVKSTTTEAGLLEMAGNLVPLAEGMKAVSVVGGGLQIQANQKTTPMQALQVPSQEQSDEPSVVGIKQETSSDAMGGKQNQSPSQKQYSSLAAQSSAPSLTKESSPMENNTVTPSELKLMQTNGMGDNLVTIKVGEPSLNSSWKQVAEEIGKMIVEKVNSEVQKVNITLNPKDLGEIDVEFFINKGKISVSLNCTNEGTKTLLASNLDSLSKIVQSSLMQDVNVNLSHDKTNGQNTNSENFDGRGNNGHYQGDSQQKKKDQEQPNLDFVQRLRLGIEGVESAEV